MTDIFVLSIQKRIRACQKHENIPAAGRVMTGEYYIGNQTLHAGEKKNREKAEGPAKKLVGIELADKAIPRHGYTVLNVDSEPIGEVTTGYHTLSTDKSVCMALVDAQYAKLDTEVQIQIRKKVFAGKVVKKQFYNKNYKK